jgi:hypothetical protein
MKKLLLSALLTFTSLFVVAQSPEKEFEYRKMTWLGYFNQTRFTEKSGLWLDLHLRLNDDFTNETHALLGRVAYIYYFSDKARLDVGYAYQEQPGHHGAVDVHEHRPWQQLQWFEKKSWFSLMQWVRFEQRFRSAGDQEYEFANHRVRYNLAVSIPLTKKEMGPKTPFLFVNNEVFINAGKNIVNNTSHLNVQLGYMNIFQQLPAGDQYVKTDAIRLFLFHSIDLRKDAD